MLHPAKAFFEEIPRVFFFIMKYVAPLYLIAILVGFSWQNLPGYLRTLAQNQVAEWTMAVIGVTLVLLVVMLVIGEKRWRAAGLDIDGARPREDHLVVRPPDQGAARARHEVVGHELCRRQRRSGRQRARRFTASRAKGPRGNFIRYSSMRGTAARQSPPTCSSEASSASTSAAWGDAG